MDNAQLDPRDIFRAYTAVFKTPQGEVVLEDMKVNANFYSTTIAPLPTGQLDPIQMAVAEGERNAVLRILRILETKEEDYVSSSAHR